MGAFVTVMQQSDASISEVFQKLVDEYRLRLWPGDRAWRQRIAKGIGRDVSTVTAHLAGENRFSFADVMAWDGFFAGSGAPGFALELALRLGSGLGVGRHWETQAIPIAEPDADLRAVMEMAEGLRAAPVDRVFDFLCEHRALQRVHMLLVEDEGVRILHCGADIPVKVAPDLIGRDLRDMKDAGYGRLLHSQMLGIASVGSIALHRLRSEAVEYRRLSVPVGGRFIVTWPDRVIFHQPLQLQ